VLENHVLPRIAGSSIGVVRDNGSAGHFSLARSDGVLDDWSIGKTLRGYSARKAQDRQVLCNVLDFQNPSLNSTPLLQHSLAQTWLARIGFRAKDAIIFAKQYHVTMSSHLPIPSRSRDGEGRPLVQQPRDLRARFWPLPGGSKQSHVLPRIAGSSMGVDSLLSRKCHPKDPGEEMSKGVLQKETSGEFLR